MHCFRMHTACSSTVTGEGSSTTEPPQTETLWTETPWTEAPWTDTLPGQRLPPGQQLPPLDRDLPYAVADPGFPRGGGANSPGGRQHTILPNFPPKLHEIERIWTPRGGRASKILLCRSATAMDRQMLLKTLPSSNFVCGW